MFPALAPGDYNADGLVGAADYELWRATFGSRSRLAADGNGDSRIDAADYVIWRNVVESIGGGAVVGVPEPTTIGTLVIAALAGTGSLKLRKSEYGE
jgi:hypothetical protein